MANKLVTTGRGCSINRPRESVAVATIAVGYIGCNEGTTLGSGLYDDGGIRHACYDAVALKEILPFGFGEADVFGKQTTMLCHLSCCVAMHGRVYAVEAVGQYAYRGYMVLQCCAVGTYVNAISQSAHNKDIRKLGRKVTYEAVADITPIVSTLSGTYNAYHTLGVKCCVAPIEQYDGRIITLA